MNLIKTFFSMTIILLLIFANYACVVYIPSFKPKKEQFTDQKQARIIVGSTSKSEVIELLGKPDILEDPRYFVYGKSYEGGNLYIIIPHPNGEIFEVPTDTRHFVVLLEFDDHDIVKRYEVESSTLHMAGRHSPEKTTISASLERNFIIKVNTKFLGLPDLFFFHSIYFSLDGERIGASGGKWDSDRIWIKDLKNDTLQIIDTEDFSEMIISPDFSRAALNKRKVTILDLNTEKVLTVFSGHGDSFWWRQEGATCLAFDPKSDLSATGGFDGQIIIWDSRTGKKFRSFLGHDGGVGSVAYSWDGRWLATRGKDEQVKLWDTTTFEKVGVFKSGRGAFGGELKFSPDSNYLAFNSGNHVEIWQMNTSLCEHIGTPALALVNVYLMPGFTPARNERPIRPTLSFSKDGKFLATSNGAIVIYDIPNKRTILRVNPSEPTFFTRFTTDESYSLAICPDGTCFATGTKLGLVYLWLINPQIDRSREVP